MTRGPRTDPQRGSPAPIHRRRDDRDKAKRRDCLMCGKRFVSEHAGNRICDGCKGTSAWRHGVDASVQGVGCGRHVRPLDPDRTGRAYR